MPSDPNDDLIYYDREKSLLEKFKEDIIAVLDVDPDIIEQAELRKGLKRSMKDFPTKRERRNMPWDELSERDKTLRKVPTWARNIMCPKCGSQMVPIRSNDTKSTESITYQCQAQNESGNYCLIVLSVVTGTYHLMRPGDFTLSDWSWERVAAKSPIAVEGVTYEDIEADTPQEIKPPSRPKNPWTQKGSRSYVLFEALWDGIFLEYLSEDELIAKVIEKRPQDESGSYRDTLEREAKGIAKMIESRTGYRVDLVNGVYAITGKGKGNHNLFPFKDEEYRREHGF